jgi:hypothetical protein
MNVRRDLQRCNIQRHIWLTAQPGRGGKMMKPHAPHVLTPKKFEVFAHTIESLKMLTGYSSTLGKHIWGRKFGSLKSHDYHVLMQ